KRDRIFRQGEALTDLYVVRAGAVKTVIQLASGRQAISGFWLAGDVLGLSGYHIGLHLEEALALDTTAVCRISLASFKHMANRLPRLHEKLACMMSEKMNATVVWHMHHSAQEKLAIFIVWLAKRMERNGNSRMEFRWPMTREDAGLHLWLATETASRWRVKFGWTRLIVVNRRDMQVRQWEKLKALAFDDERKVIKH